MEILDGIKTEPITIYHVGDQWWDLCAGPHVESTGQLTPRAIELQSVAGAYWRGDETKAMLQVIASHISFLLCMKQQRLITAHALLLHLPVLCPLTLSYFASYRTLRTTTAYLWNSLGDHGTTEAAQEENRRSEEERSPHSRQEAQLVLHPRGCRGRDGVLAPQGQHHTPRHRGLLERRTRQGECAALACLPIFR